MRLSDDLPAGKWMYLKGGLFILMSIIAGALLLIQSPHWQTALLLAICVWSACRAYYFAFYVIEHYIDPEFRFAGLVDFAKYLIQNSRSENRK